MVANASHYTVKQVARLAGVSVRTLHYYDEIGLLKPSSVGQNGYRYYADAELFRLQQILFYRELEVELLQIKALLDDPAFDQVAALQAHREALHAKRDRLDTLIHTLDATLTHLTGGMTMSKKRIFDGFSAETEARHQREAAEQFGAATVQASYKLWNSYSEAKKTQIKEEGGAIYAALAAQLSQAPDSPAVQALLAQWHAHLRHFYEPSLEVLRGLGNAYHEHPEFNATFTALHPDLPAFLQAAINHYVDVLEHQWLERELGLLSE